MSASVRHRKWEVAVAAVSKAEMRDRGGSWVFNVDREYLRDLGCVVQVVICGWSIDVYRPL